MLVKIYYMVFSILAPMFVLFFPKGLLTVRIMEGVTNKNMSLFEKLNCFVPYYNSYKIWIAINGTAAFFKYFNIVAILTFIVALIVRFIIPLNSVDATVYQFIQVIASFWLIAFMLLTYLVEVFIHVDLFKMFDKKALMVSSILPPVASALLAPHVLPFFKKYRTNIEGTFDGDNSI